MDTNDRLISFFFRNFNFNGRNCTYRLIQVLLPEPQHPLLIDLKFSKNSGIIVYGCRIFCKNLNFFNETSKYFVLIQ
jgi:hypothetical protein